MPAKTPALRRAIPPPRLSSTPQSPLRSASRCGVTSVPRVIAVRTGGDVAPVAEQDRADDPAVGDHELAVFVPAVVLERDHLVVRRGALEAADRGQLDADDLEDRDRHDALVGLLAAGGVVGRDLGLRDRGRPQARAAGRSNSATSPAASIAGSSVRIRVVDEHAALDPQPRVAGELDVGLDAGGDEQDVRLELRPSLRSRPRRRPLASTDSTSASITNSSPSPSR